MTLSWFPPLSAGNPGRRKIVFWKEKSLRNQGSRRLSVILSLVQCFLNPRCLCTGTPPASRQSSRVAGDRLLVSVDTSSSLSLGFSNRKNTVPVGHHVIVRLCTAPGQRKIGECEKVHSLSGSVHTPCTVMLSGTLGYTSRARRAGDLLEEQ